MPHLLGGMSEEKKKEVALAITNFLVGSDVVAASTNRADGRAGERLFHESGCLACHAPQDGREYQANTSVPLVGLGDKYSRGSLEAFLKDPQQFELQDECHDWISVGMVGDMLPNI